MPLLSGIAANIRGAVSSLVGAIMLVIPVVPGAGAEHHPATAVKPASTAVVQSTGLFATACVAAGSWLAGTAVGADGRRPGTRPVVSWYPVAAAAECRGAAVRPGQRPSLSRWQQLRGGRRLPVRQVRQPAGIHRHRVARTMGARVHAAP